jgi:hypothetical protein
MSTQHTMTIPAATMDALRSYASVRRAVQGPPVGDLPAADPPLTAAERQGLLNALSYWREQQTVAALRVREITARLGGP